MKVNILNKVEFTFRALKHKNFRYFWTGQCISLIGTWMQNIGQSWLVLTLTKSAFLLGLVGTLQFLPMMLFSLFAGVIIDKYPKKRILLITQSSLMILAFILSLLVWTGYVKYWHILILALLLGVVNTLDMPTRQAFMIELVGKEDLVNAIALNSSIFNIARIIGPAVAGIMMGIMGIAFCFFLNGISFIAVIIGLIMIKTEPFIRRSNGEKNMIKDIKDGILYALKNEIIYITLMTLTVLNIFIMNFNITIPVFAKNVLGLQEEGFGFLMSAMGAGSFLGALTVASDKRSSYKKDMMYLSALLASIMLIILSYSKSSLTTELLLFITGFFTITFTANANSTIQINTNDEFRGRVMSLYTLLFAGTTPIGNFIAGSLTAMVGPKTGFLIAGIVSFTLISSLQLIKYYELKFHALR